MFVKMMQVASSKPSNIAERVFKFVFWILIAVFVLNHIVLSVTLCLNAAIVSRNTVAVSADVGLVSPTLLSGSETKEKLGEIKVYSSLDNDDVFVSFGSIEDGVGAEIPGVTIIRTAIGSSMKYNSKDRILAVPLVDSVTFDKISITSSVIIHLLSDAVVFFVMVALYDVVFSKKRLSFKIMYWLVLAIHVLLFGIVGLMLSDYYLESMSQAYFNIYWILLFSKVIVVMYADVISKKLGRLL